MDIVLETPGVTGLGEAVAALREWQHDGAPMQLHPGDLGWFHSRGAEATAAALRTWRRDGRLLAVALLDGADMLRLTMAPDSHADAGLAAQLAADLADPARGVLPAGAATIEAPTGALVHEVLRDSGWHVGEAWTPLCRDLAQPVAPPGIRVEVARPGEGAAWIAVQRASFAASRFTAERWQAVAAGSPFADARFLVGYDGDGVAVASIAVWSAGPGRPGLVEPMGVHRDHRGRGHGRAITLAGAAALRELGSSSLLVCTPSAAISAAGGPAAIATYVSAGFQRLPERHDTSRAG